MNRNGRLLKRRTRRGTAVVETALMAPLILAGTLGVMEVGYTFMAKQTVTLAAREGARAGVLPGANEADVQAQVDETMGGLGVSGYDTNIDMGTDEDPTVTVTVTLPFDRASFTGNFFGGSFDLVGQAAMRREGAMPEEEDDGIEEG